jgi:hypothetical protein
LLNGAFCNLALFYYIIGMKKDLLLRIGIILALIAGFILVAVLRSGTAW